jgi:acyl-[acyl-carrier-protein]-phospholipid O-acyltransferase/long-chain-fatty-acid--[acyl-carrier-protein] ligase
MLELQTDSLSSWAFKNLKRNFGATLLIDRTGLARKAFTGGKILAIAAVLADKITQIKEERVGIILPPGIGGFVTNLAVALAGKSSVNLNYTASTQAAREMLETSGVKTIITAAAMKEKFKEFPWTADTWDIKELLANDVAKKEITIRYLQAMILPANILAKLWGVSWQNRNGKNEATLLFSSGSTGKPKGIPLTQGNILANLRQIEAINLLPNDVRLLANLPLFHSFGLTVTMWFTLTHRVRVVSFPNPLDTEATGKIVEEEEIDIIVGTPSFYRLYINRIPRDKFKSLKCVVAGAEKTPKGLHEKWKEHFGSVYLEGYGLTETTPVTNVNLPYDNRIGTVGRAVKELQTRITDVTTGEVISAPDTRGVIEFKGPNVFGGYLHDEKLNAEVFRDGWFWTGDLGSLSADGFLTVDGRLKRFSKIGGEMVPHAAIEEAIIKAFGWEEETPLCVAVCGAPDETKGEHLVVVSTREIEIAELREKLQAAGLPNLWIPKKLVKVAEIPLLPSGKLDLMKLREVAQNA